MKICEFKKWIEKIKMIPYGRQDISQADIDSVINTLKSDFLTQGPQVPLQSVMSIDQQKFIIQKLKDLLYG